VEEEVVLLLCLKALHSPLQGGFVEEHSAFKHSSYLPLPPPL